MHQKNTLERNTKHARSKAELIGSRGKKRVYQDYAQARGFIYGHRSHSRSMSPLSRGLRKKQSYSKPSATLFNSALNTDQIKSPSNSSKEITTKHSTSPKLVDYFDFANQCASKELIPEAGFVVPKTLQESNILYGAHFGVGPKKIAALSDHLLKHSGNIVRLDLRNNRLKRDGICVLASALQNESLEYLDISSCQIGPQSGTLIAQIVSNCENLHTFLCCDNALGDTGVEMFCEYLIQKTHKTLKNLDMGYNLIGKRGASAIFQLLYFKLSIQQLSLRWNRISGKDVADSIADVIRKSSSLTLLDLSWNALGLDSGLIGLALSDCPHGPLKHLNLSFNDINGHATMAIGRGIARHRNITILKLCSNPIEKSGIRALVRAIGKRDAEQPVISIDLQGCTFSLGIEAQSVLHGQGTSFTISPPSSPVSNPKSASKNKNHALKPAKDSHTASSTSPSNQNLHTGARTQGDEVLNYTWTSNGKLFDDGRMTGLYYCDLFISQDRYIAHELLMKNEEKGFQNIPYLRYGNKIIIDDTLKEWRALCLPRTGILAIQFITIKEEPQERVDPSRRGTSKKEKENSESEKRHMSHENAAKTISSMLNSMMTTTSHTRVNQHQVAYVLDTATREIRFTSVQARDFVMFFDDSEKRIQVASLLFPRIIDGHNCSKLFLPLSNLERAAICKNVGPALYFDRQFPSGHYRLDLSNKSHRVLAEVLFELALQQHEDQDQVRILLLDKLMHRHKKLSKHKSISSLLLEKDKQNDVDYREHKESLLPPEYAVISPVDVSQTGNQLPWRNETLDGVEFELHENWVVPKSGILEFDFASFVRPPQIARYLSNSDFWWIITEVVSPLLSCPAQNCANEQARDGKNLYGLRYRLCTYI